MYATVKQNYVNRTELKEKHVGGTEPDLQNNQTYFTWPQYHSYLRIRPENGRN